MYIYIYISFFFSGTAARVDAPRWKMRTLTKWSPNAMRISRKSQSFKRTSLSYKPLLNQRIFQVRMCNTSPWLWVSDDKQQR